MAIFTNQATLTYNGSSTNSNIAYGEILDVLAVTKTAVEGSYTTGGLVTYVVTLRNTGAVALSGLTVTDDLGGYDFNGTTVYPLTYEENSAALFVNGVPQGYSAEAGKVQTMIGDLLLILSEDHNALPEMMVANMASKFARLGSLSGDPLTNPVQAQRLIDDLFACENPEYTSNGRKVITLMPVEELDKKF